MTEAKCSEVGGRGEVTEGEVEMNTGARRPPVIDRQRDWK